MKETESLRASLYERTLDYILATGKDAKTKEQMEFALKHIIEAAKKAKETVAEYEGNLTK